MRPAPGSRKRKASCSTDSDGDDAASFGSRARMQRRVPTEIWESMRPFITKHYQGEKKSLKEVMDIMKTEHNFTATVKMFKSRIWKWGLDKKLKSDEVLAILILKRDRDLSDKPSEFFIRGQPVDMDNIRRYVKRNPSLPTKARAGHVPSAQTSREVACRTPSPPPCRPLFGLPDSGEMYNVQSILFLFRDYVDGSFSSGAWRCEFDVDCSNSLIDQGKRSNELFERVIASFALVNRCMMRRDELDINSVLGPAFECLKEIVAAESPDLVARTVCLLWYLDRHHKHDLLRLVLDYLAGLIPIVLGQQHILAHIWKSLSETHITDYYELSMRLYAFLLPEIEGRVGSANFLTHILYSDYVDCVFSRQGPEECESTLSEHLARVEASGKQHPWLGDMALSYAGILASCKERQGRLEEAIDVLTGHMNAYSMTKDQEAGLHLELGVKYYRMGDIIAAGASFQSAAQIALTFDSDERLTMTALANLDKVLEEAGQHIKADQVRQYRMGRLALFAEKSASISKGVEDEEDADGDADSAEAARNDVPVWLWWCDQYDTTDNNDSNDSNDKPETWLGDSYTAKEGVFDTIPIPLDWTDTSQTTTIIDTSFLETPDVGFGMCREPFIFDECEFAAP